MKLLLLLFLFLGCAWSVCDRARILSCAFQYVDQDGDHRINATEINNFMLEQPCGRLSQIITADRFLQYCDKSGDGFFNETDYDAPLSCFNSNGVRKYICLNCDRCDEFFPSHKKKKEEELRHRARRTNTIKK